MPPIDKKEGIEIAAETESKKNKDSKSKNEKGNAKTNANVISEEDQELKDRLETCVKTLLNTESEASVTTQIRLTSLDMIIKELRTATSSMTSVPKPLKFLKPFFDSLKKLHEDLSKLTFDTVSDDNGNVNMDGETLDVSLLLLRARLADVMAVLSMTLGKQEERESLSFKLSGMKDYESLDSISSKSINEKTDEKQSINTKKDDNLGSWGHEFVRSLTGEIGQEYNDRVIAGADPDQDEPFQDLLSMVDVIVPFHMDHNAEAEAVDLLMDVQRLNKLLDLDAIDSKNYKRICAYLIKTSDFQSDPDDLKVNQYYITLST